MFQPYGTEGSLLRFTFDGVEITAREGDTIAAALLAAGQVATGRNPVSGAPRAPYCMMGSCFECQVLVDGVAVQACQVQVRDGMTVLPLKLPKVPS